MKLSISNIAWDAEHDKSVYEIMDQMGFSGLEIAPTRWVQKTPYENVEKACQIAKMLKKDYGFVVSSMQSIWFGKSEQIFANEKERQELLEYTKKAIDYAQAIGCKNLVFGCPKSRNILEEWALSPEETETIAVTFFRELGDYAALKGTVIGMEANPAIYNTNFVNTTEQAFDLIEKVNSKGFLLNLDVGTMIQNEEAISLLKGKVHLINHIHVSEPWLKPIEERKLHKELVETLIEENYEKFISIEMGKQEDIDVIQNVMKYISEVFCD